MARCRECGARTWFRSTCAGCEAARRLREGLSRAGGEGSVEYRETTIHRSSTTRIDVIVDGKRVSVSSDEGATPELLERLTGELGLSVDEVSELLDGALAETVNVGGVEAAQPGSAGRARGPLVKIDCPGCSRSVPAREGWCMYCGAEFEAETRAAEGAAASEAAEVEEVDRRFLEEDVRPAEDAPEAARDEIRESYRDRLSDL